ncbi:Phospholipid phosphatase 1 [Armadillidium nasatum]|uniref:Phospholipid phosphatase 1 n=1 Tax=Armadillidium nasatum TaxID=96803 RepID=A0A5N5SLT8_9CRUS|nr:Phospholipid phosphatase 1 [Armadillidium nasatum]
MFKEAMPSPNEKLLISICTDVVLLLIVLAPVLILYIVGSPLQRGFFCNDVTIRYPYIPSVLPGVIVVVLFIIAPIFVVLLIEYLHVRKCSASFRRKDKIKKWLLSFFKFLKVFLFGLGLSLMTVVIFKFTLGRLRPHFIDVCNPDWSQSNCSSAPEQYVEEDICNPESDEDDNLIRNARLSFMSSRASTSAYSMFFIIFYLQYRLIVQSYSLLRPFLQYLFFALAIYVSISSIASNDNHWSDVFAGFLNVYTFLGLPINCC